MRALLLGKNGQLGGELERTLAPLGDITALDYVELELQDFSLLRHEKRRNLINSQAYQSQSLKAKENPYHLFESIHSWCRIHA